MGRDWAFRKWFRRDTIPAWFLVLFKPALEFVRFLGDVDFLVSAWGRMKPFLPQPALVWELVASWGWLPMTLGGFVWLYVITKRPETVPVGTTPKVPPLLTPATVSDHERRLIQDVRAVWYQHGVNAAGSVNEVFRSVIEYMGSKYWHPLLHPMAEDLSKKYHQLTSALLDENAPRLADVHGRINDLYEAYLVVLEWLFNITQNGDNYMEAGRYNQNMKLWMEYHLAFHRELTQLRTDPDHAGLRFRSGHIKTDALLQLMPQAPDTEEPPRPSGDSGDAGR